MGKDEYFDTFEPIFPKNFFTGRMSERRKYPLRDKMRTFNLASVYFLALTNLRSRKISYKFPSSLTLKIIS